ncbi:MAG: hypothetical protein K1X48_08480 [Burkholderiaceae bacterium]|nr:hypothetical protein [Burkholderiaceae bacterium]
MSSWFRKILEGARQVLVLSPPVNYIRPARGDFAQDVKNLRGDFEQVASDMRKGVAKYGDYKI